MKWEIVHKSQKSKVKSQKFTNEELINILLENRGIKTRKEKEDFLHPNLEDVTVDSVGIDKRQLKKAIRRIQKAIEKKEQIVVFGDYDVDGIAGSAILWETLHGLGANVLPYIPNRIEEGYGLSSKGISNVKSQMSNLKLIITVDNGIVANEAVEFANEQGIDVIITDHHVPSKKLPDAYAIVHTTKMCGGGVAWLLAREIKKHFAVIASKAKQSQVKGIAASSRRDGIPRNDNFEEDEHLELVALATIADMVPLTGANRILVVYGLQALQKTRRLGLRALLEEAGIDPGSIGVYEVGHIIAPRLNASGRMASAMDSLRLLCTKDRARAMQLAVLLGKTNRERQTEMIANAEHAISQIAKRKSQSAKLLFISHSHYQQGTIGLVAGKLVEVFYRPAIVVSIGEKESKASARSISGFNMIEFLRLHTEYFINVGGHPMAAGFTVDTAKLSLLQSRLETSAKELINGDILTRKIKVDCELPFGMISDELYSNIQCLAPFGVGNPEPTFVSINVVVEDARVIGREGKHLKLRLSKQKLRTHNSEPRTIEAVAFGMGGRVDDVHVGDIIAIAYTIDENQWNGSKKLQLKIKEIKS